MADFFAKSLRSDSKGRGSPGMSPLSKAQTTPDATSMKAALTPTPRGLQRQQTSSPADRGFRPLSARKTGTPGSATHRLQRTDSATDSPGLPSPRAGSVVSTDDSNQEEVDSVIDIDAVKVIVRVRPANETEMSTAGHYECLGSVGTTQLQVSLKDQDTRQFTYDQVLEESTSQEKVFEVVGQAVVDNCMAGYNSSIFAYGQTGSGKTHTVMGVLDDKELKGLAPRVFEYLFTLVEADCEEDSKGREGYRVSYRLTVSFLEIYNEVITDLLTDSKPTKLEIRESSSAGCYVDGLKTFTVESVGDVLKLMQKGAQKRHVGETRLNAESSRSHSVFTCFIEKTTKSDNGLTNVITSRLNLIDLAGSERVKSGGMGGSQVQGEHLKETCYINSSLSTLGRVIQQLVDQQKTGRKGHIPYRESRLTFLLQDSLGGNAKTMIIANVSPSAMCGHETISTLQFATRAKCMRNRAHINVDAQGDKQLLQREIQRLNTELDQLRKGQADPAIAENKELRHRLDTLDQEYQKLHIVHKALKADCQEARRAREIAETKMTSMDQQQRELMDHNSKLVKRVEGMEADMSAADNKRDAQSAAELRIAQLAHQHAKEALDKERKASEAVHSEVQQLRQKLAAAQDSAAGEAAELRRQLAAAQDKAVADVVALQRQLAEAQRSGSTAAEKEQQLQEQVVRLNEEVAALRSEQETAVAAGHVLQSQLLEAGSARLLLEQGKGEAEQEAQRLQQQLQAVIEELEQRCAAFDELSRVYEDMRQQYGSVSAQLQEERGCREKAERSSKELQAQVEALQQQLGQEQQQHAERSKQAEALQQQVAQLDSHVAALDSELATTTSSLQHHKEQVSELQQQLADERQQLGSTRTASAAAEATMVASIAALEHKVSGLSNDLASSRAALEQEQASHSSSRAALAEVQEALDQAQLELSHMHHGQEEGEQRLCKLQDKLQRATSTMQAKEVEVTKLMQDLHDTADRLGQQEQHSAQLQADLDARSGELADRQQELAQRQQELQGLQQQLVQEQQQVASTREELAKEQEQRGKVQQQVQELQQQLAQARSDAVNKDAAAAAVLATEQAAHSGTQQQLQQALQQAAQLQGQLSQQERLHSEHVASSSQQQERASSKMAQQQEQIAALRAQVHEAQERHAALEVELSAKVRELESQLGALRSEKSGMLSYMSSKDAEVDDLRAQLQDLQQHADTVQHKLDKEEHAHTMDRSNAESMQQSLQQQLEQQRRAYEKLKADSSQRDREQQDQIQDLHLRVVNEQEEKGALKSELLRKLTDQNKELEMLRSKHTSVQKQLITTQQELDKTSTSLAEEKESRSRTETLLQEKERYISHLCKAMTDTTSKTEEEKSSLKKEQQQLMEALEDKETVLKDELVRQARHQRAFGEIRRLIDWATTPPSSMRSSLRGSIDGAANSDANSPTTSPRPRQFHRFQSMYHTPASAPTDLGTSFESMRKSPEPGLGPLSSRTTPGDHVTMVTPSWAAKLGANCDLSASVDQE